MKRPTLKTYRRSFQVFIAVAFIVIPILNRSDYSHVYGNYLSFHLFGIPFADPLAILQLSIKNLYLTLDNVIGALLPLLLAFVLGTVFCSWICAYGLLSEWTRQLSRKILGPAYGGLGLYRKGFPFKMAVFILGFIGFFIFSTTPILNQLSMPAWYSRFFQYLFGQDLLSFSIFFILAVLGIEFFAQKRLWCRYICPQSILITLVKQLDRKRMKVVFDPEKCICRAGYERCEAACSLNLKPKTLYDLVELECSNCGDCVVACTKMGRALSFDCVLTREAAAKTNLQAALPVLKKGGVVAACVIALAAAGYVAIPALRTVWLADRNAAVSSTLLGNKKISWENGRAEYYELLEDGTLVCVGGDWPLEGFKGWRWQPVGADGSFTILEESSRPGSHRVVRMLDRMGTSARFVMEQYVDGAKVEGKDAEYRIASYDSLAENHAQTATVMDATVVLNRYADEVYTLDLEVLDPGGKKIRKILSQGDLITTEGMLTAVHRWINSPVIVAAEGEPPKLPIHTRMVLRFRDGSEKKISFSTTAGSIRDHSTEVFDDPWF